MTIKELKEAVEAKKVVFGIKQIVKAKKTKKSKVSVCSDSREETLKLLTEKGIEFESLKKKKVDVAKELNLNFLSEVFLVQ